MNTAVVNVKTSPETKKAAMKIVEDLGLSLSSVLNAYMKQIIRTREVRFVDHSQEEVAPSLAQAIEEAESNVKSGLVSPIFDNSDDLIAWLHNPHKTYEENLSNDQGIR